MSDTHAQTTPFVRETMVPQAPPPAGQTGAVRWLRQNLFSTWLNTILTIAGLVAIFFLLRGLVPWLAHSVWNANSLSECRQIIADRWGPDATGACWAVVRDRWTQWLFGFYPRELYWRPVLALALMFVAAAPVLFPALPRRLLVLSLLYPFVGFWLLWGGSIWTPVGGLVGFVIWYGVWTALASRAPFIGVVLGFLLAVFWWLFLGHDVMRLISDTVPYGIQSVRSDRFGGFVLSLTIGVAAIAMSLPMGIALALGRQSDMFLIKTLCVGFIEFIRGVPLITLLFTASLLLNYFLPPGTSFDIILRVIIMVTLFAAAYIAEVIRGGLAALPRGQYEAGDALGLNYFQAQRLIILPQALKISIPGIVSTFIGLFKDTTLVIFVGLLDPLKGITDAVRASFDWKGIYWEPYIFVGSIFFLFCFGMSRYSMYLERRLKRDHR
ncbi:amino acid ABC transporter permease [Falsirhodobacter halotolerans]|uniref:amino acid ABC transporter permease n=1 Tax=Falsirhodobacter halotolerans TaxID=1146892 RepID=UPI001FD62531|nr:amino acid ABC transporter permease [Falsirhodobacter halotolerans]MCJ8138553.1 ABC transporter permease subunit [Falsirhodobacter halotolerans]